MFRATTPKHTFLFDVDPDVTFKDILITYAQGNGIILEKGKSDLTFEDPQTISGKTVYPAYLVLTQEESKRFAAIKTVNVQVRALTFDNEAVACDKIQVSVKDVLNDEVLT